MKPNIHGIRFKIWISCFGSLLIVLIFIWVFQSYFYQNNYRPLREQQIGKLGTKISERYDSFEKKEDFFSYVAKTSAQEAISIYVVYDTSDQREEKMNLLNLCSYSLGLEIVSIEPRISKLEFFISEIDITKSETLVDADDNGNSYAIYLDYLGIGDFLIDGEVASIKDCPIYLVIESKIDPISAEVTILNIQMLIAIFLSILLSTLIMYYISIRISRPIQNITKQAQQLANGNYETVFFGEGYIEIVELAESLNHMRSELSKTTLLQRKLIANISHDLRTPLTLIKSYAEMVRDLSFKNDEKRTKHLNVIIDETDRLTLLVNDILSLSKMQSNMDVLEKTNFNLSSLLEKVINRFDILVQKDGYSFESEIDKDIFIFADLRKIEQALYNLISNSATYTGEDKKIMISLKKTDVIRFEVTDTGSGIDDCEIQDIWTRYYRSKDPHKRSHIGTGLGLTIVKEIFDSHGFSYGVTSKKNVGSTFFFEIK